MGKKLQEVVSSQSASEKYDLHFAEGTTEVGFDLVVGGDGAWSQVRNSLSSEKPRCSGISMVAASLEDVHGNPWLKEYISEGTMFAFGDDTSIAAQRGYNGYMLTYASL